MRRYALPLLVLMLLPFTTSQQVVFQEDFSSISEWRCYNLERGSKKYTYHDKKGVCKAGDGKLFLMEESNRDRIVERNVTLPEGELSLYVSASGHVDASWSNSKMMVQGTREKTVFNIDNDYSSSDVTCSWDGEVDISRFAGEEVRIRFLARGRRTYDYENTTSWVRADQLRIEKGEAVGNLSRDCSREIPETDHDPGVEPFDPDSPVPLERGVDSRVSAALRVIMGMLF